MTVSVTFPGGRAETIRPLEPRDLPTVALLFQRNFRDRSRAPAPSLQSYLGQLFLEHPFGAPDLMSRVHLSNDGSVNGFIGVLPLRMNFRGRKIRAALAGSLMVDDPEKDPLAGAKLLRSFLAGPQDLSLSETANLVSHRMWTALGGHAVPLSSMEWLRALRPAGAGVNLLAASVPLLKILRPFAAAADGVIEWTKRNPLRLPDVKHELKTRDIEADEDALIEHALRFASGFSLRPEWDAAELRFILAHAACKERHGAIIRRLVYAEGDQPIGGYIYYCRPGGVAWVLQVLAQSGRAGPVLDNLMRHAREQGAVALRGRTDAALVDSLLSRRCVFTHRSSTMVHARDPALLAAALSGDALITGMAGEAWTRIIGGIFR